jgi:hypothetical protein
MTAKINLHEKFVLFAERSQPKIIAAVNGQEVTHIPVMPGLVLVKPGNDDRG